MVREYILCTKKGLEPNPSHLVEASGLVRPQSGGKRSETKRYIISNYPLVQKQGSNEPKQTIKKEVALFYFLFIVTQSEVAYW